MCPSRKQTGMSDNRGEKYGNIFNDFVFAMRSSIIFVWNVFDGRWPEDGGR